jgi:hypothetical protein
MEGKTTCGIRREHNAIDDHVLPALGLHLAVEVRIDHSGSRGQDLHRATAVRMNPRPPRCCQ